MLYSGANIAIPPEAAATTPSLPSAPRRSGNIASGPASPITPAPLAKAKNVGRLTMLPLYWLSPAERYTPPSAFGITDSAAELYAPDGVLPPADVPKPNIASTEPNSLEAAIRASIFARSARMETVRLRKLPFPVTAKFAILSAMPLNAFVKTFSVMPATLPPCARKLSSARDAPSVQSPCAASTFAL